MTFINGRQLYILKLFSYLCLLSLYTRDPKFKHMVSLSLSVYISIIYRNRNQRTNQSNQQTTILLSPTISSPSFFWVFHLSNLSLFNHIASVNTSLLSFALAYSILKKSCPSFFHHWSAKLWRGLETSVYKPNWWVCLSIFWFDEISVASIHKIEVAH